MQKTLSFHGYKLLLEEHKKVCTNKFNSFDIPIMQRNLSEVHDKLMLYINTGFCQNFM